MIASEWGGVVEPDEPRGGPHLVVLALDPGMTTGWSRFSYPMSLLVELGAGRSASKCEWEHGQLVRGEGIGDGYSHQRHVDGIMDLARDAWAEADDERGDVFVMVIESFSLRMLSMDPSLLAPVMVLEVLKDRLFKAGDAAPPWFTQTPADAKTIVNNQRLQRWGVYETGSGEHARDADRHNLLFARRFVGNPKLQVRILGSRVEGHLARFPEEAE